MIFSKLGYFLFCIFYKLLYLISRYFLLTIPILFGIYCFMAPPLTALYISITAAAIYWCFLKIYNRNLNGSTMVVRIRNEFMMSLQIDSKKLKRDSNSKKSRTNILIDEFIEGLKIYCGKPSIFKRPLYIRTNQKIIDEIKKRVPTHMINVGEPIFKVNFVRLLYINPFCIFNNLMYAKITKKTAHYKFHISHEELMQIKSYV